MKQFTTQAIILARTDYGEADRILTVLTPEYGKLRLLAKGVRRIKSKLAGGIELFSISDITFIRGRGDIGTLVSARLAIHYGHIVGDLERTMLGYELIKQLHKVTEDEAEVEYFELLRETFAALDDARVPVDLTRLWFAASMMRLDGRTPNLRIDAVGVTLRADQTYDFNFERMAFVTPSSGQNCFDARDIKLLRLVFQGQVPRELARVQGAKQLADRCWPLVQAIAQQHDM